MQRKTPTKNGFTLFETLVVLVIVAAMASIAFTQIRQRQMAAAAETFIAMQAREMQQFARAVQTRAAALSSAWPVGVRQEITAAQLISAGDLPATFATRGGTAGASPIGETYRAFAIKDAAGVVRIVIADAGRPPTDAFVRRAGYQVNATSLRGYKLRVTEQNSTQHRATAATISAGSLTATGLLSSFTRDLTAYFPTVPTLPIAVQLVGWPEHPDNNPLNPNPTARVNQTCDIVLAEAQSPSEPGGFCRNGFGNRTSCATHNIFTNALNWTPPTCPTRNGQTPQPAARLPICEGGANTVITLQNGIQMSYMMTADVESTSTGQFSAACAARLGINVNDRVPLIRRERFQAFANNGTTTSRTMCQFTQQLLIDEPWNGGRGCYVDTSSPVPNPVRDGVFQNMGGTWQLQQIPQAGGTPTVNPRTHLVCCYDLPPN